jgi:carbonic anhydrase
VDHLGIPLLVLLGHTNCGAVTAVVQREEVEGNLLKLAQDIGPAVERSVTARPMLRGPERVDEAAKENIWFQVERLFESSPVVRHAVAADKLQVVGAFYDILHGDVNWLGKHPDQASLIQTGA